MTDTRTNEQILTDRGFYLEEAENITAALAAAGRLVTPEHDAQVLDRAVRSLRLARVMRMDRRPDGWWQGMDEAEQIVAGQAGAQS